MQSRLTLALLLLTILTVTQAEDCPQTHFDFRSGYTLGKQDELNKTFTLMQKNITHLGDVSYHPNDTLTFTITKATPTFQYIDTKQRATIRGNDTVVIDGGFLLVDITFNWIRKGFTTTNGTAKVEGKSGEVVFVKEMVISDNKFYSYELLDAFSVEFSNDAFALTRVDPPDTSQADQAFIMEMVNHLYDQHGLRKELQDEIDKQFRPILKQCLHDEQDPIQVEFKYVYQSHHSSTNQTLTFKRRPVKVDLQKQGLSTSFDIRVSNDDDWKCIERNIPLTPRTSSVYGGVQEFISLDFYENVLHHSIRKGHLNTQLNKQNWQNRLFQFYAGDLYDVIPEMQQYYATEPVTGKCQALNSGLSVVYASIQRFNVTMKYQCTLTVQSTQFANMDLKIWLTVDGKPRARSIDFKLHSHYHEAKIEGLGLFTVQNLELAEAMVSHGLNRLYNHHLFGSDWPLSPPRDYPKFAVTNNFTIVYDAIQPVA